MADATQERPQPQYDPSVFNARRDLYQDLGQYASELTRTILVGEKREEVEKYGLLGLLAQSVPMHIYTHPALVAECQTAFTDGARVYIYADYFLRMLEEEGQRKHSVMPLLLHELSHIFRMHTTRMRAGYDPKLANIAQDVRIDQDIASGWPEFKNNGGDTFLKEGFAFQPGYEIFEKMAEENIYFELLKNPQKFQLPTPCSGTLQQLMENIRNECDQLAQNPGDPRTQGFADSVKNLIDQLTSKPQPNDPSPRTTAEQLAQAAQDLAQQLAQQQGQPAPQGQPGQQGGQQGQPGQQPGTTPQSGKGAQGAQGAQPSNGTPQGAQGNQPANGAAQPASGGSQGAGTTQAGQGAAGQGQSGQGSGTPGAGSPGAGSGTGSDQNGTGQGQGQDQGQGSGQAPADAPNSPQGATSPRGSSNASSGSGNISSGGQGGGGSSSPSSGGSGSAPGTGNPFSGRPLPEQLGALTNALNTLLSGQSLANGVPKGFGITINAELNANNHVIPPEKLAELLQGNGMGEIADKLGIDTRPKISELEADMQSRIINAAREAVEKEAKSGGKYPGSHLNDYARNMIKDLTKPKLNFKFALRDIVHGEGTKFAKTMDEPGDLFYVDPTEMGLLDPVYIGSDIPSKSETIVVGIIDSSGSVSNEMYGTFASELLGIASEDVENKPDVLLFSADTIMRGEPDLITEDNVMDFLRDGVARKGYGGTDFEHPIRQSVEFAKKVYLERYQRQPRSVTVLYFSDLECYAPDPRKLPEGMGALVFFGPQENVSPTFEKAIEGFAKVIGIKPNEVVDLEQIELDLLDRRGGRPRMAA